MRVKAESGPVTQGPSSNLWAGLTLVALAAACSSKSAELEAVPHASGAMVSAWAEGNLPQTAAVIKILAQNNGRLSVSSQGALEKKLANALAEDLETSFQVQGLPRFTEGQKPEILSVDKAAREQGLVIFYDFGTGAANQAVSINIVVSKVLDERPSVNLPDFRADTLTQFNAQDLPINSFTVVLATSGNFTPLGATLYSAGGPIILLNPRTIASNASLSGVDPSQLMQDVAINEAAHLAISSYLGQNTQEQRVGLKIKGLREGVQVSLLQYEEAYSDYYTFKFGPVPISYYCEATARRSAIERYKLSSELFFEGIKGFVAKYPDQIAAAGITSNLNLRTIGKELGEAGKLEYLANFARAEVVAAYHKFFEASLPSVKKLLDARGK